MKSHRYKHLMSQTLAYSEMVVNDRRLLTPTERGDGWHFCSQFDGLLTQTETPSGDFPCQCGAIAPVRFTYEGKEYIAIRRKIYFPAYLREEAEADRVVSLEDLIEADTGDSLMPPDYVDVRDHPSIAALFEHVTLHHLHKSDNWRGESQRSSD